MAINSKLAVAVHILALLEIDKGARITSEYIAGSVNTNPVVIRRIIGMLSKAKLVHTTPGVAGAKLMRPIGEITLLDIYHAVQAEDQDALFTIHEQPNPDCLVGRNIQGALELSFNQAQQALENELASVTLEQVVTNVLQAKTNIK